MFVSPVPLTFSFSRVDGSVVDVGISGVPETWKTVMGGFKVLEWYAFPPFLIFLN